jgi:hypothetical protein
MKIQEEYEKLLVDLSETNYILSQQLAGFRVNGHISHLFGRPLDEIYNIIIKHEQQEKLNEN